jgi:uracil-DNA glycosylase
VVSKLDVLIEEARQCTVCDPDLPAGPRPVLAAAAEAKILIIGQAPGRRVHASGVPWDDPSGNRLRQWLGVEKEVFYNPRLFAIIPMGFCYPGTGASGDLPPRPECAPLWHDQILENLPAVGLTLLLSQFAQTYYLGSKRKKTLTETVRSYHQYGPRFMPLPHPSPRNNRWLKKNSWFESEVLPELKRRVGQLLAS